MLGHMGSFCIARITENGSETVAESVSGDTEENFEKNDKIMKEVEDKYFGGDMDGSWAKSYEPGDLSPFN